jgi:mRNA interferase MazF
MKMPSTINYEPGDVVLVGFPFTNLKTTKQRPAVIVNSSQYRDYRPDLILIAVTSQIRDPLTFGEYLLADWKAAGLLKPSVLKPLIATVEQRIVLRKLGTLSSGDKKALSELLQLVLDF